MKPKTISIKIIFGIILLAAIFLLFIKVGIEETYAKSLKEKEMLYNVQITNKTKEQFDFFVELVDDTMNIMVQNEEIKEIVMQQEGDSVVSESNQSDIMTLFKNTREMQSFINDIHLIGLNGSIITTNTDEYGKEVKKHFEEYINQYKSSYDYRGRWTPMYAIEMGDYTNVISCIYPIYDNSRELKGIVVMDLAYEFIHKMFIVSSIQLQDRALIVDSEGNLLFGYPHFTTLDSVLEKYPELLTHENMQINGVIFKQDTLIVSQTINRLEWKIIRLIETNNVTKELQELSNSFQIFLVLISVIAVIYAALYAKIITKPLRELIATCKRVEKGDLSVSVQVKTKDEIGQLANTFNIMLEKLNEYFAKELKDQYRKSEMQFQILQAQINPHFLYNTLDSIKWLAVMQNVNNIAEMSNALINLLKYNLGNINAETTLKEEVESVKNYIVIQKYRYGDIFTFTTSIDEEALECKVVRFLLQPLVENCIIHGFNETNNDYRIHISATIYDNILHIKVIDNGTGIDKEKKNQINNGIDKSGRFSNIGIQNVKERIKLHFGNDYDLIYDSEPSIATIAELILPFIIEEDKKG